MSIDIASLFDPTVFESIEVKIAAENSSTGMKPPKEPPSVFCELSDAEIVLELPRRSCAEGHHLMVFIEAKVPGEKELFKMQLTVKVGSVDELDDTVERVGCVPMQYEEKEWARFRGFFASRQEQINNFLTSSRGY